MIKKTYKELRQLDNLIGELYRKNPALKDSKFGYGYKKFVDKNLADIVADYNMALMDIKIDNALIDPTSKALLRTKEGGFQYSKEGEKKCMRDSNTLEKEWFLKEIDVEPYIIKPEYLPVLDEDQIEIMKGILIAE